MSATLFSLLSVTVAFVALVAMLNADVTPVVCEKGSVGACGDLAPMSQIALLMMGEGEAFFGGERLPGHAALERAGIPVPGLRARDGLAIINGSNLLNAIGALAVYDAERWLKQADIAAAMSLEALKANMKPYQPQLHELRGFRGAITCAANLRKVMDGSDLITGVEKVKVQDAYSMRSTPQVIGAARDYEEQTVCFSRDLIAIPAESGKEGDLCRDHRERSGSIADPHRSVFYFARTSRTARANSLAVWKRFSGFFS